MNIKLDRFLNYTFLSLDILILMLYHHFPMIGVGRHIPYYLSIVCLGVNVYYSKRIFNTPYIYWFLWVVFAILNTYFKGGQLEQSGTQLSVFCQIFSNFVLLYVVSLEFQRNRIYLLKFIIVCLLIYAFGSFFSVTSILGGRELAFDGNTTILMIMFLPMFGMLLFQYKRLSMPMLLLYIVVALYFIVVGATRKAIGGLAIVGFLFVLSRVDFRSFKAIMFVIIAFVVVYFAFDYMMENTVLGERLEEGVDRDDLFVPYELRDHWFFSFVGDRGRYYFLGWKCFINNFWTGLGLKNYMMYDPEGHTLHTEYMVQFAECGLIGFTLYVLFMGWMAYNLLYIFFKIEKRETLIYAGIYGAILFISFTAWTYQFPIYFIVFGVIIGYCKDKRLIKKLYANRNL